MKSLLSLATGGSLGTVLKAIPNVVKVPLAFGVGLLAAADLTTDMNHAWFSAQMFGGEAAKGLAQSVDPTETRRKLKVGAPVSGAEATTAAQYEGLDADARQKAATADAAEESEDEILAKKAAGLKITTTEQARLLELGIKRQEMRNVAAQARLTEHNLHFFESGDAVISQSRTGDDVLDGLLGLSDLGKPLKRK